MSSPATREHTSRVSDLFSDAAQERTATSRRSPPGSGRSDWTSSSARSTWSARARRCGWRSRRTASVGVFYGPPGTGKTTLARIVANTTGRRVRGALGRVGHRRRRARGARAGAASGSAGRAAHDPVPRRDPPLQQGPAGRAAARGRGGARDADRRDDGEPVLRGELGAPVANAALRARAALRGGSSPRSCAAARPSSARRCRTSCWRWSRSAPAATRARRSNILELACRRRRGRRAGRARSHVEDAARKRPLVYDKGGDAHYDFISALIKSMRARDPTRPSTTSR